MDSDKYLGKKTFVVIGLFLVVTAIILGAFGTHGLEENLKLPKDQITSWKTGVSYQLSMGIGVIIMAIVNKVFDSNLKNLPFILLSAGSILFAASIYVLVLNHQWNIEGLKYAMGPLTPIGGMLIISSWIIFIKQVITND